MSTLSDTTPSPHDVMSSKIKLKEDKIILACIDGSEVTKAVCDYAAWYAHKLDLPITLLHALKAPKSSRHDLSGAIGMNSRRSLLEELTQLDEKTARIALKHGEALINDAKTYIKDNHPNGINVNSHQRNTSLLEAIEHFAKRAQVIIMGRHGEDHQRRATKPSKPSELNLGSQIETVARAMHQPILLCSEHFSLPHSYMLAFDGSVTANKAVDMICNSDLSRNLKGYLVMVDHHDSKHVNSLYKAKEKLDKAGLEVEIAQLDSKNHDRDVVNALIEFQTVNNISICVIGAYGHSKLRQLFVGSTTTKLLANTTAPVLLLR